MDRFLEVAARSGILNELTLRCGRTSSDDEEDLVLLYFIMEPLARLYLSAFGQRGTCHIHIQLWTAYANGLMKPMCSMDENGNYCFPLHHLSEHTPRSCDGSSLARTDL